MNPYFSNSIQKFWNNWHISLSTWLRDYIFFPLRRSLIRTKYSHTWFVMLMPPLLTMLVSGLWHGEGWTYLIWGMIHGIYLFGENLIRPAIDSFFEKQRSKLISGFYQFTCILLTFSLVCFGWIFFRANSVEDAFQLMRNIKELNWTGYQLAIQKGGVNALIEPFVFDGGLNKENFILSVLLIGFLLGAEQAHEKFDLGKKFNGFATPVRWLFYCGAIFAIVMLSTDNSTQNFIYFKF